MEQYCFLNGQTLPVSEAKVGVKDIGLLRGYGLYEGIPVFRGRPFRFADHWARFLDGAHGLELNIPITEEKAEKIIKELSEKNGLQDRACAKMILTGGQSTGNLEYDFEQPTFYIIMERHEPLPEKLYAEGAKLITYRNLRPWPQYKTTSYVQAVGLQNFRKQSGAAEIIYTYDGEVLEGSGSNIFIVKDKKVITPAENVLPGITRKVVLELARESYKIEERLVYESELSTSDEVFITSSFKDILPITEVDEAKVGNGEVGEVVRDLMARFKEYVAKS